MLATSLPPECALDHLLHISATGVSRECCLRDQLRSHQPSAFAAEPERASLRRGPQTVVTEVAVPPGRVGDVLHVDAAGQTSGRLREHSPAEMRAERQAAGPALDGDGLVTLALEQFMERSRSRRPARGRGTTRPVAAHLCGPGLRSRTDPRPRRGTTRRSRRSAARGRLEHAPAAALAPSGAPTPPACAPPGLGPGALSLSPVPRPRASSPVLGAAAGGACVRPRVAVRRRGRRTACRGAGGLCHGGGKRTEVCPWLGVQDLIRTTVG